mmetsp:Transcript_5908/g.16567  ORF Transcript_5908/g.16567 Transcript_5908/m.16567 type:complete len:101 (+) Transcript_5908:760-1062(+)
MNKVSSSDMFCQSFTSPNQASNQVSPMPLQSCKDILSLALDAYPEPQPSSFVSLEALPETINDLFADELAADEFEPIPLCEGAQQQTFRLVDPDQNIFAL